LPVSVAKGSARYEPLQADEVAAFKQAMAKSTGSPPRPAPAKAWPASDRLRKETPDFEDTELVEAGSPQSPLSATQYGELN
jgi:hypothetical protein